MWSVISSFVVTVAVFLASQRLHQRFRHPLLSPILISPLTLIVLLLTTDTSYSTYNSGGQWLSKLLEPATVAFAVPLHKHFHLIKKYAMEIVTSIAIGSTVALITSTLMAGWAHLNGQMIDSLAPRSVTTPVAMNISEALGGVPTLTAVFVLVTGISGMLLGPTLLRRLPIRNPIATGLFFGMGAHGAGTSRAFEIGELEGTVSSLSMILAAIASLLIAPWIVPFFEHMV
ncbi:MAG: CidB/LrgB family autolysis modulator [Tumebacillaceae bacterium]